MDDDMSDISPQISRVQPPQLELKWSSQFTVSSSSHPSRLPGDKLNLPPSALEALLAAAPTTVTDAPSNRSYTSTFDPGNPYTYAAERAARAQFQEHQKQLPQPLTFRLVNPQNDRIIYAGIREFSAEEGEIELSAFLREALDIQSEVAVQDTSAERSDGEDETMSNGIRATGPRITVHAAQLPKGTFVKLRPLEAGYDPEDWKALLEQHLRANFTTLTHGEVLSVPSGKSEYRFLVDGFKPEGDGICIVDTDIEVDIEALNEEQARETVKRIAEKARKAPGTEHGSSVGGDLSIHGKSVEGQVISGDYVDYQIPSWPRDHGVEIELSVSDDEDEIDLYVSPFGARQRIRPREDEYLWAETSSRYPKRIRLSPTNVELEEAEAIYISVHAFQPASQLDESVTSAAPKRFTLRASVFDAKLSLPSEHSDPASSATPPTPGDVQCKNCHQWLPSASLILHENFCLRNNILCPHGCGRVFQKRSETFKNHWHCEECPDPAHTYGDTALSKLKHDQLTHTPATCPDASCGMTLPSVAALAQHRVTECQGKMILCQFCHLQVPQGVADDPSVLAECLMSNLTPHELADGARTTECHLCGKIVRLRDMRTHLLNHELEKKSRLAPRVCRNVNCGRTLDGVNKSGDTRAGTRMGNGPGNDVGLCSTCFGPLYVSMYDPDGKALKRRVERRYLSQLLQGCGKSWCRNQFCKTGRTHMDVSPAAVPTKDALPMIRPYLDALLVKVAEGDEADLKPLHFCVDEGSQKRRALAEMLAAEGVYRFEWCVAALEVEGGKIDGARSWLEGWAPRKV
ncbi:UFD1-domain-containing protein [Rhizodiscina lignyota]|uniref:UFD1-domain-containing protein n=1 Tax=Rhizodiscina lignyota TaxID=1504668 RepID=A0A9P4I999_9PEZI|nr:UFD1-domain-containing protein [Rhizodiscina lignyota]